MKSIEALFKKQTEKNPLWSTLVCFNTAVAKQKFAKEVIARHFKLVDKKDYSPSMKISLINQAIKLSSLK